jgi:5-methylcytosine-specific restriction endonuclease McrA
MSYSVKGEQRNTGRTHFKKGFTPWNKGKTGIYSDEYRRKIGEASHESQKRLGAYRKGKTCSISHKNKIKTTLIKRFANIPKRSGHVYQNNFWRELRKLVYRRDGWKCQECGCAFSGSKRPAAHHIDYNPNNNELSNLISLCNRCHGKTNYKTDQWINYYKSKMEIIQSAYSTRSIKWLE